MHFRGSGCKIYTNLSIQSLGVIPMKILITDLTLHILAMNQDQSGNPPYQLYTGSIIIFYQSALIVGHDRAFTLLENR